MLLIAAMLAVGAVYGAYLVCRPRRAGQGEPAAATLNKPSIGLHGALVDMVQPCRS